MSTKTKINKTRLLRHHCDCCGEITGEVFCRVDQQQWFPDAYEHQVLADRGFAQPEYWHETARTYGHAACLTAA